MRRQIVHHERWKRPQEFGDEVVYISMTWCGLRSIVESDEPYTKPDADQVFAVENQCKKCLKAKEREA